MVRATPATVSAIGIELAQPGDFRHRLSDDRRCNIAVLDTGRGHAEGEQQPQGIDDEGTFAPLTALLASELNAGLRPGLPRAVVSVCIETHPQLTRYHEGCRRIFILKTAARECQERKKSIFGNSLQLVYLNAEQFPMGEANCGF